MPTVYDLLDEGTRAAYPLDALDDGMRRFLSQPIPGAPTNADQVRRVVASKLPYATKQYMAKADAHRFVGEFGNPFNPTPPAQDAGIVPAPPDEMTPGLAELGEQSAAYDAAARSRLPELRARTSIGRRALATFAAGAIPSMYRSAAEELAAPEPTLSDPSAFAAVDPATMGGTLQLGEAVGRAATMARRKALTEPPAVLPAEHVADFAGGMAGFGASVGALTMLGIPAPVAFGATAAGQPGTAKERLVSGATTAGTAALLGPTAKGFQRGLMRTVGQRGVAGAVAATAVSKAPGAVAFGAAEPWARSSIMQITGDPDYPMPTFAEGAKSAGAFLLADLLLGAVPHADLRSGTIRKPAFMEAAEYGAQTADLRARAKQVADARAGVLDPKIEAARAARGWTSRPFSPSDINVTPDGMDWIERGGTPEPKPNPNIAAAVAAVQNHPVVREAMIRPVQTPAEMDASEIARARIDRTVGGKPIRLTLPGGQEVQAIIGDVRVYKNRTGAPEVRLLVIDPADGTAVPVVYPDVATFARSVRGANVGTVAENMRGATTGPQGQPVVPWERPVHEAAAGEARTEVAGTKLAEADALIARLEKGRPAGNDKGFARWKRRLANAVAERDKLRGMAPEAAGTSVQGDEAAATSSATAPAATPVAETVALPQLRKGEIPTDAHLTAMSEADLTDAGLAAIARLRKLRSAPTADVAAVTAWDDALRRIAIERGKRRKAAAEVAPPPAPAEGTIRVEPAGESPAAPRATTTAPETPPGEGKPVGAAETPVAKRTGFEDNPFLAPSEARTPPTPPARAPKEKPEPKRADIFAVTMPSPPKGAKGVEGIPEADVPEGGLTSKPRSLAQAMKQGVDAVKKVLEQATAAFNPSHFATGEMLDDFMREWGDTRYEAWQQSINSARVSKWADVLTEGQVMDILDRIEAGGEQATPVAQAIADQWRARYDQGYKAIAVFKPGLPYIENYFMHMWDNPAKAAEWAQTYRPLEGSKRFTKERFYGTVRDGLKAGLKLKSRNLERMVQAFEHDARKFVFFHTLMEQWKETKLARFLPVFEAMPDGWATPESKSFRQIMSPEYDISEWQDAALLKALNDTNRAIGATMERKVTGVLYKGRKALGLSEASPGDAGRIKIRVGAPIDVAFHELGHAIDAKYGMKDVFVRSLTKERRAELRALAELRYKDEAGKDVADKAFIRYANKASERMAALVQAYIYMPDQLQRIAPKNFARLVVFLTAHPELHALRDAKKSLRLSEMVSKGRIPGMVVGGSWILPKPIVRLIDNMESSDVVRKSALGLSLLHTFQTVTGFKLGLSAFHALTETQVAFANDLGTALGRAITPGEGGKAIRGLGPSFTGALAGGGLGALLGGATAGPFGAVAGAMVGSGIKYRREGKARMARGDVREAFHGGFNPDLEGQSEHASPTYEAFMRATREAMARKGVKKLAPAARVALLSPLLAINAPIRLISDHYTVPLKVAAFYEELATEAKRRELDLLEGRVTYGELARRTMNNMDDRYGLLNYDAQFWNRGLKSAMMLAQTATGWVHGTQRALGGAALIDAPRFLNELRKGSAGRPDFTPRMRWLLGSIFAHFAIGGTLHYLFTGKRPETIEDYNHPMGPDGQRLILKDYPQEGQRWLEDPLGEEFGRTNVLAYDPVKKRYYRAGMLGGGGKLQGGLVSLHELATNITHRGPIFDLSKNASAYERAGEVVKYLYGVVDPISISSARQLAERTGGNPSLADILLTQGGARPYYEKKKTGENFYFGGNKKRRMVAAP